MELPVVYYTREDYAETASGNKICVKNTEPGSLLFGTQNIMIAGKTIVMKDVTLRGDSACVKIGSYCILKQGTIIRPTLIQTEEKDAFCVLNIGDHVFIEENCVIQASSIGAFTHIEADVIIGNNASIKECCRVEAGSVILEDEVFPPFSTIAGNPARVVGNEYYSTEFLMRNATKDFYNNFVPKQ